MAGQLPSKYRKGSNSGEKADLRKYVQNLVTGAFHEHAAHLERIYSTATKEATRATESAHAASTAVGDAQVTLENVEAAVARMEALQKDMQALSRKVGIQLASAKQVLKDIERRI